MKVFIYYVGMPGDQTIHMVFAADREQADAAAALEIHAEDFECVTQCSEFGVPEADFATSFVIRA